MCQKNYMQHTKEDVHNVEHQTKEQKRRGFSHAIIKAVTLFYMTTMEILCLGISETEKKKGNLKDQGRTGSMTQQETVEKLKEAETKLVAAVKTIDDLREELVSMKEKNQELKYRTIGAESKLEQIHSISKFHIVGIHGKTNKEIEQEEAVVMSGSNDGA